jgi:hypothetical protein
VGSSRCCGGFPLAGGDDGGGTFGIELVVLHEPVHEMPEACLKRGSGAVAEVVRGVADVGVRERHVAVAGHGDDAPVRLLAEELLEDGDHAGDGHRRGVAEVAHAEWRGPALLPGPGARAIPGRVERAEAAPYDVVDVGEVAAHVGGAEQRDGIAGNDAEGEGEVRHVGSLLLNYVVWTNSNKSLS